MCCNVDHSKVQMNTNAIPSWQKSKLYYIYVRAWADWSRMRDHKLHQTYHYHAATLQHCHSSMVNQLSQMGTSTSSWGLSSVANKQNVSTVWSTRETERTNIHINMIHFPQKNLNPHILHIKQICNYRRAVLTCGCLALSLSLFVDVAKPETSRWSKPKT